MMRRMNMLTNKHVILNGLSQTAWGARNVILGKGERRVESLRRFWGASILCSRKANRTLTFRILWWEWESYYKMYGETRIVETSQAELRVILRDGIKNTVK